jgi:hypothetical protein
MGDTHLSAEVRVTISYVSLSMWSRSNGGCSSNVKTCAHSPEEEHTQKKMQFTNGEKNMKRMNQI